MPGENINYTLNGHSYQYTVNENELFNGLQIVSHKEWEKPKYAGVKKKIKEAYLLIQLDRCGYCRTYIEPDGYYEPLEHIVAKTIKPKWIFNTKNLTVACDPCNNLKHTDDVLNENYIGSENCPEGDQCYSVFHPHFEEWNAHLEIENEIFIRAKDGKGENTVKVYHLNRYHIPIKLSRENQIGIEESSKRIAHRLRELNPESETYIQLKLALEHLAQRNR